MPVIRFLAIVLTGMALVAPAAHAYELLNKIGLTQEQYFIVQRIYDGWWMAGCLLPAAIAANLALAFAARYDRTTVRLALVAAGLVALNLVIFFIWTQPANAATANWTVQSENWEALRRQWEYSHAVNAAVIFAAFCASTCAALRAPR
jgi:hypothetical protein